MTRPSPDAATTRRQSPRPRSRRVPHLRCDVATDIDSLSSIRCEWDELVRSTGAGIALTYDWCRAWWRHYGARSDSHILIFHAADRLAAVVPIAITTVSCGLGRVRVARPFGATSTQSLCNLPAPVEHVYPVLAETVLRLFLDAHCDIVQFGPASNASHQQVFEAAAAAAGPLAQVLSNRVITQNTVIHLPGNHDAYLASLSRNQRANLRKEWKRLTSRHDVRFDQTTAPGELESEFEALVEMHHQQWRAQGQLGHFGDWPGAVGFNRTLVNALGEAGRVLFVRMRVDGRIVARQCCFIFGDTLFCRIAARSPEPRWSSYGLGRMILSHIIELAISQGLRRVDVGTGHYEYKLRLGGVETPVWTSLLASARVSLYPRAHVLYYVSTALDRLYYKTWRYRVAPRLGLPPRPLWDAWIRTRL